MAAIVWAMEHFNIYLRGRTFTVYSDHKPLEAHSKRHEKILCRLQEAYTRWNFNIVYKKGAEMPADYLSRNAVEAIRISGEVVAERQDMDPLLKTIKNLMHVCCFYVTLDYRIDICIRGSNYNIFDIKTF